MNKKKLVVTLSILTAIVAFSLSLVGAQSILKTPSNTQQSVFKVSNLSCGSCLATIEGELNNYEGMVGMDADLSQGLVIVSHTDAFNKDQIAAAITKAGYPAKSLSQNQAALAQKVPSRNSGYGCGGGCCGTSRPVNLPTPN